MTDADEPKRPLTTYFETTAEMYQQGRVYDSQKFVALGALVAVVGVAVLLALWLL